MSTERSKILKRNGLTTLNPEYTKTGYRVSFAQSGSTLGPLPTLDVCLSDQDIEDYPGLTNPDIALIKLGLMTDPRNTEEQ